MTTFATEDVLAVTELVEDNRSLGPVTTARIILESLAEQGRLLPPGTSLVMREIPNVSSGRDLIEVTLRVGEAIFLHGSFDQTERVWVFQP